MFLDSHRMAFTFLSWLDFLGVALAFQISNLKKSSNYFQTTNTWLYIVDATSFEKYSECSSGHTLTLNLVKYRFKNMFRKESLTRSSTVI